LQLLRIHPLDGKAVTTRFQIGDVDGMTKAALADAAAGHNAYIEPRALRPGTRGRGKAEDTVGVFALVVDGDADKGRAGSLDLLPSLVVETSPGNRHLWLFLDRALPATEAQELGAALPPLVPITTRA
jgi:hypothetical protein